MSSTYSEQAWTLGINIGVEYSWIQHQMSPKWSLFVRLKEWEQGNTIDADSTSL